MSTYFSIKFFSIENFFIINKFPTVIFFTWEEFIKFYFGLFILNFELLHPLGEFLLCVVCRFGGRVVLVLPVWLRGCVAVCLRVCLPVSLSPCLTAWLSPSLLPYLTSWLCVCLSHWFFFIISFVFFLIFFFFFDFGFDSCLPAFNPPLSCPHSAFYGVIIFELELCYIQIH